MRWNLHKENTIITDNNPSIVGMQRASRNRYGIWSIFTVCGSWRHMQAFQQEQSYVQAEVLLLHFWQALSQLWLLWICLSALEHKSLCLQWQVKTVTTEGKFIATVSLWSGFDTVVSMKASYGSRIFSQTGTECLHKHEVVNHQSHRLSIGIWNM